MSMKRYGWQRCEDCGRRATGYGQNEDGGCYDVQIAAHTERGSRDSGLSGASGRSPSPVARGPPMNELRWILIGFGFILIAGIYLWGRRAGSSVQQASAPGDAVRRPEPLVMPLDQTEEVVATKEIPSSPPA